jgi:hypothetical protein
MLSHDLEILKDLDEQNPPPSPLFKGMDFSSSKDLSLSQLLNQMSPDLWAQLNTAVTSNNIPKVVVGNLLGYQ